MNHLRRGRVTPPVGRAEHRLDRDRPFVGINSDYHTLCLVLPQSFMHHPPEPRIDLMLESGGQRYFELDGPLLRLSRP